MQVTLYKALQSTVTGADLETRGLDVADDPHGYAGTPSTTGKGGAYFTTDAALALSLAAKRDYGNGILVVELEQTEYDALCKSGDILPDPYLPSSSVRVQPGAFPAFNQATSSPGGSRTYHPSGSRLPGGQQIPP